MTVRKLIEIVPKEQDVCVIDFQTGGTIYAGAFYAIPDDALLWGMKIVAIRAYDHYLTVSVACV